MPDREKIIKGWECHMEADTLGCADCPYRQGWRTCNFADTLFKDVYALLKDQEAKPMIENELGWNCRSCGMTLIEKTASGYPCNLIDLPEDEPIHFCPRCGQEVKWE